MRPIDADALWKAMQREYTDGDCADADRYKVGINVGITKCHNLMSKAPTMKTKEVKYYDEDEKVWKTGEVIVNCSEIPNNCEDKTERSE